MKTKFKLNKTQRAHFTRTILDDIGSESHIICDKELEEFYNLIKNTINDSNKLAEKILSFLVGCTHLELEKYLAEVYNDTLKSGEKTVL